MSRVWTCGFENQSVTAMVESDSITGTCTIDTTTKRSGGASLKVNPSSASAYGTTQFSWTSQEGDATANAYYFRGYIYITAYPTSISTTLPNNDVSIFEVNAGSAVLLVSIDGSGALRLYDYTPALVGSPSAALALNTWYRIEFAYCAEAGSTILELLVNGTNVATTTTNASNLDPTVFRYGNSVGTATMTIYYDDMAINYNDGSSQSIYPGSGKVIFLKPNAAGDASNWAANRTGGTAGNGNNYTRVNETPPNDATSFNGSVTLNEEDLHNCADSGISSKDKVNVVCVGVRFRRAAVSGTSSAFKLEIEKTSGGTKTQSGAIVSVGTGWYTNNQTLGPSNYRLITYADPDGAPWTQATLDSMQIGYKISTGTATRVDVSTVGACVDYPPAIISDPIINHGVISRPR
jgi:hypothetical protein